MAKQVSNGGGDSSLPTAAEHAAKRREARDRKRRAAHRGSAASTGLIATTNNRHVGEGLSSAYDRRQEQIERTEMFTIFFRRQAGLATLWIEGRPTNEKPQAKLAVQAMLAYLELYCEVEVLASRGDHVRAVTKAVHDQLQIKFREQYDRCKGAVGYGIGVARKALDAVEAQAMALWYDEKDERGNPASDDPNDLDDYFLGDRATFGFAPAASPFAQLRGLFRDHAA